MKKKNLKGLSLNKKRISKIQDFKVVGGINQTNPWICSAQCSVNPRYCDTRRSCTC
jgi:hypothetical protein